MLVNTNAQGSRGTADLYFFPVDNKLGRGDPTMTQLLSVIEQRIDESDYVHEEKPLSWLQVLRRMSFCWIP
jgi:hypothetical protein